MQPKGISSYKYTGSKKGNKAKAVKEGSVAEEKTESASMERQEEHSHDSQSGVYDSAPSKAKKKGVKRAIEEGPK